MKRYPFELILQQVEHSIQQLNIPTQPNGLYDPISYTLSLGGKRIRPALLLMATNMYSDDLSKAIAPAMGIEIFHNFTLLHDDLMDGALVRRGNPTVHIRWNRNTAILSGDVMQILAYRQISQTQPELLPIVLECFSQTATEICEGQQLDMEFETRMEVSAEEYMEMIRLKTAVLLAASLQIGAIIGEAPLEQSKLLYQVGIEMGLAFQIQDDILDAYGEEQQFGKRTGGDILCNKKTLLLITALQQADQKRLSELSHWLSVDQYEPQQKIDSVIDIYDQLHVKEICQQRMLQHFDRALELLDSISLPHENKEPLLELFHTLLHRNR